MFLLCVHKYSEILSITRQFAAAEAVFSDVLDPDYPFASRLDERKAAILWTSKSDSIALQGEHKRADLLLQDLLNECRQKFGVGDLFDFRRRSVPGNGSVIVAFDGPELIRLQLI